MNKVFTELLTERALPPDMDAAVFEKALARLVTALGSANVVSDLETLSGYIDLYPLEPSQNNAPSVVLYPGSPEDVQAIVPPVDGRQSERAAAIRYRTVF